MSPKLLFVSLWDAANPNAESGYAYSIRQQLRRRFHVSDLFPLALPSEGFWLPLRAAYKITGRYYHPMREPTILKSLARRVEWAIKSAKPDVVFAPSSVPLTYVDSAVPTVYVTDQVFRDFIGSYVQRPSARFCQLGDLQEGRALASAARVSFPSRWAAESAVQHYDANPTKISVIPWGANLPHEIAEDTIQAAIAARPLDRCRLVFLGVDWRRKGGNTLVSTVNELNRLGVRTEAIVIGCDPGGLPPERFTVHRYLDKRRDDQFARFASIMASSHFLFLPSRAEAFAQAFCEAAAFGLPAIGSAVGGIPDLIRNGETGFVRHPETSPKEFAALIQDVLAAPAQYVRLARQAREDHHQRLNWDRFGERLAEVVMAVT
jgi:glycosyltransferase involved in cell wall biosynthesis